MSFSVYSKLYFSCFTPVLDYGSEIWGIYNCSYEIKKVHMPAARIFLCLNKFTPTLGIEGDIGWDSCELRIHIAILKYWNYY